MQSPEQIREKIAVFSKLMMASIGITALAFGGLANLLAAEPGRFFWWFLAISGSGVVFFLTACVVFFMLIMQLIRDL